ncbi:MAG: ATP-binding cassette domain-containing protein [Bauldia sp.]|nr:ATP-binding cassette domain-containing protein [Bauldia sp.]
MPVPSLKLSAISKRYPGVQALAEMSFECLPGEIHAVLGENGSGKSTLLGIASGAVAQDSGTIEIMGAPLVAADPQLARRIGLATVYQDDSLVREFTVAQNLVLGTISPPGDPHAFAEAQLAAHDLPISPDALVGSLSASERQFLEIVKALVGNPRVLLLDEPTSSLDLSDVAKLTAIIRKITSEGTAVVYVSHRLPEILDLADRVTILRDGVGQGVYVVDEGLSEHDLISLMVGREIESGFPPRADAATATVGFFATRLSGAGFSEVSLHVDRGEVLGFAGAEGNGQRDAIRALGGLEPATGHIVCDGRVVPLGSPADALAAGVLSLSADRAHESIFPVLGVRENMTVQVLDDFASGGIVSARRERARAVELIQELGIVTSTLDKPISGLSGGNQQKAVLARSFLHEAKAILIDEPTQGVDARARFDIYRAIRARTAAGSACIVNSSDAMELAGLCDRVAVFSRGRIVRVLVGREVTEENIVSSFLTSRDTRAARAEEARAAEGAKGRSVIASVRDALSGGATQWWTPLLFLLILILAVGAYATFQSDAFLSPINIRYILLATAPLALVTMAQFNVLMVRGFDVSVGSMMNVTVVLASFVMASGTPTAMLVPGAFLCIAAGVVVGLVNGSLIRFLGLNPVITTIATLSVLQGFALYLRPSPGGLISEELTALLKARIGFLPVSFLVIVAVALLADLWLYRTRGGLGLRAVGFREEAAKRNGVHVNRVHLRAYLLSAVIATFAGFFLASEVGTGTPVVGSAYTLPSIAAAVLGGAALSGGRGSFLGAVLGALFFTLTVNVVTLLGLSTALGIIISGALTLFAVFLYSGWEPVGWLLRKFEAASRQRRTAAGAG